MDIASLRIAIDTREAMAARRDLASVESQAGKTEQATVRMARQSTQALGDMSSYVKQVAASFTAMLGIRMADEFAKMNAQLKLATGSVEGFARAQASVVSIAKEAQSSVGALSSLYARLTAGSAELGFSQQKVSDITRAVALSLKVSNATTAESQSAILQLSQAMGAGALRGEEFNSVNEAAPRLMKALADAIGVPIGALRGLAEQGKLTTEVLGYALPQALGSLEKEAAGMGAILGAFQVIKDQVMLFVGATAQSSGAVSVLTGVMTLAAQNLQLLAAAATGFVATKVATYMINLAVETKTLVTTTMATIAANKAAAAATLEKARADALATSSALALSNARVAELRAAVLAASGASALAVATNGLIPAQARAAAASIAHTEALAAQAVASRAAAGASGIASTALGLLGGPIGAITTLLGLGITAWMAWGSQSSSSAAQAAISTEKSTNEIIGDMDRQIEKLKERNRLADIGLGSLVKGETEYAAKLGSLQKQIDNLQNNGTLNGNGARLPETARLELLKVTYTQMGQILGRQKELTAEQEKSTGQTQAKKLADDMAKYLSAAEKAAAEVARLEKEHGAAFTPEMRERILATVPAMKAVQTEAQKLADAGVELQKSLTAKDSGLSPELAKQWDSLGAAYKAGKLNIDELTESQRLLLEQQPFIVDGKKKEADIIKEISKLHEDSLKPFEQSLEAQIKRVESLQTEEAAVKMARELNISLAQAVEMVNIAKLKEQQIAAMGNPEAIAAIEREIEERKKLIDLIGGKEARDASTKAAEKSAADWKRTAEKIEDALTDSLMRGFEKGKDFGQNLKDTLENMFKAMVLRPIIQATIGGIGLGGSGGASANGGVGDLMKLKDIASGGSNIMNFLTGKTGMSEASGMWTRAGDWMSTSSNGTMANAGSWMQANPQMASYAGMAGNALAGYGIQKGISGEYKIGDGKLVDALTIAASAYFGPIAGVVAGVANRAFGMAAKKVTGESLRGSFGESGADTSMVSTWAQKGGWFRKNKSGTNTTAVTGELDAYMDASIGSMFSATREAAKILGMNADAINGFTQSIDLNLKDLNEEQRTKAINDALGGFGDALAQKLGAESMDALVKFAQQVMQQRTQLENQLLQLQGNTTELRKRERDQLHETNRALYDQIKALEDSNAATKASEQIRSAWKSIGDGLMDEVNRIRGIVASESGYSLAYLQSEFAILTAATRAGDQVAGGKLSGVASAISEAAAMQASSALELAVMRSNVANSLERTNQIVTGAPVSVNTPILTANSAEDTKAMRAQIEALNARINELTTNSKAENQAQFNALNKLVSIMDTATQGGSMAVRTINGETVKTS